MKQHIYFCSDVNYLKFSTVTMASILFNAKKNTEIVFNIMSSDFTSEIKNKITELKNIKDCEINFIDVDEEKFNKFKNKIDMGYLPITCFYRLLIPEYATQDIEKALYLDGDIIVREDLTELFNTDLTGFNAGVVEEKDAIQIKNLNLKHDRYFNSGMLLLNLTELKKSNLADISLEYFMNNYKNFVCRDQDVLNGIWDGKTKFLSNRYNAVSFDKTVKKPIIIHFTGYTKKPWKPFCNHKLKHEWLQYNQMTSFKKSLSELIVFKLTSFKEKTFSIRKDPTHKNYYSIRFLGVKFGVGTKDDKRKYLQAV